MKYCKNCGTPLNTTAKFCRECGATQPQRAHKATQDSSNIQTFLCSHCGAQLREGSIFCKRCGKQVAAAAKPVHSPAAIEIPVAPGTKVSISDQPPTALGFMQGGLAALTSPGEMVLGDFSKGVEEAAGVLADKVKKSTLAVLGSGLFGTIGNIFKIFTSIKALLATLIAGGFWALFPTLANQGIDFPQWFTILTMAGGRAGGAAGGAALLLGRFSFISGLAALGKFRSGSIPEKLTGGRNILFLIGFSLALAIGSFAATANFVGAAAMAICALAAGKAREGFLWDLASSLGRDSDAKLFINGASAGFSLAALLGVGFMESYGLGAGAAMFIIFGLFSLLSKKKAGGAALMLLVFLTSAVFSFSSKAEPAEWVLYDTRVDTSDSTGTLTVTDGEDAVLATDTTTIKLTSSNTAEIYYGMLGKTVQVQWETPPSSFPVDEDLHIAYSGNEGFDTRTIYGTFGDSESVGVAADPMNLPFFMSSTGVTCRVPMFMNHNGPLFITINISSRSMSGAKITVTYEYRRSKPAAPAGSVTIDTWAGDVAGDDESSAAEIPDGIVDAVAGVAAAAAAAGGSVKKGKKRQNPKEEKAKPRSIYRMILTKNFGDTLEYDADPVPVYARIVEIMPSGHTVERRDLTARINIFSAGILDVSPCTMAGDHMGAMVSVKTTGNMELKSTEQLSVRFNGPEGIFQNNITFRLIKKEILFSQDNITFPANCSYSARLPFAIIGLSENAAVTADITPKGGFSLSIERDRDDNNLWYADITETGTASKPAGTFEPFTLHVNAVDNNRQLDGYLDVFRFHTGLSVKIANSDIACYLKDGKPVRTPMTMTLFTWNDETHEVIQALPIPTGFEVKAETGDICEKLKLGCKVEGSPFNGTWQCFISPYGAILDSPARHKAVVTVTAEWNHETYTAQCEVLLLSQPRRESVDPQQYSDMLKEDSRIRERLAGIKRRIWNDNYTARLFPLVRVIETMLDGYDADFGYDPWQVDMVAQTYNGFMNGSILGANAEPQNLTLMDELKYAACEAYKGTDESVEAFEASLGFWKRLGLGFATLGFSEVTFTAFKVPREMKRYVDQGGNSVIEGFWVGTKIVVWDYIAEKATGGLARGAKKLGPLAKEITDGVKVEGKKAITKFSARLKSVGAEKAISAEKALKGTAENSADEMIKKFRRTAEFSPEDLAKEQAFLKGRANGLLKMQELARARAQLKQNPMSAEAREAFEKLCKEVQSDKHAVHQLQHYKGMYGDDLRAEFNRTWQQTYDVVQEDSMNEIAARLGVPRDSIEVLNVSGNSNVKVSTGRSVPMDHDVTFVYVTRDGKVDVDLRLSEEIYNRNFYRRTMGAEPPSAEAARAHALKYDQSVVADGSLEKYGPSVRDVKRMLDPEAMAEKLSDASAIKKTVVHKSEHFIKQARELMEQAKTAPNADELLEQAQALIEEANRQSTKQAKRSLLPRAVAAKANNGSYEIPMRTRTMIELMNKVGLGEQGPLGIEPGELERILRDEFGVTLEEAFEEIGDCFVKVDAGRV
ncbi:MAG: zinc ribbon domain-containing protein [Thermoclostridium sp.]|nr:zinc ribbon domain-containing protein [Thermoclostridium sp.]